MFIPCAGQVRPVGRVEALTVPPAELAIIVHEGPHDGIDRAYGALATHVTQHALAVDGPIREYYLSGRSDTPDESAWRTEIGWPIFRTGVHDVRAGPGREGGQGCLHMTGSERITGG